MSQNLYARPRIPRKGTGLDNALKFILRKQFELREDSPDVFSEGDILYLSGLRDAGVAGASDLIELIKKHGEVEAWQE